MANTCHPLTLILPVLLVGCSSKPVVVEIGNAPKGPIRGVPFRVKTEHNVQIFALQPDGTYSEVSRAPQTIADTSKLYAIDVEAQPLASGSLHIAEAADNTLSTMQVTGTDHTAAALDAVNNGVAGVTKAGNDKTTVELTAATAANAADKALRDAQDALDKLPGTASAETRAAYEAAVASAKRAANLARAATGLPTLP